ncbi:MAG: PQQ-binding-like beta-propeller repeat protein [Chloroflexi bacterium]|nr:PQQ-binding-like beta-propeller repeat protein [Chloroflexota bacterium]
MDIAWSINMQGFIMASIVTLIGKDNPMQIKQTKNKKRLVSVVIITLLSIMIFWLLQNAATAPKVSPWQISDQSPEFSLISIHKINAEARRYGSEDPTFLILRNSSLIFQESAGRISYKGRFNRIDLLTGQLESQIIPDQSISGFTNNQQTIFIAQDTYRIPVYSGQTLKEPGAIFIKAFDIGTGNVEWTSVYEGFALISYMNANENQVRISGHNGHGADRDQTVLDALTGEVLEGDINDTFQSGGNLPSYFHIADLGDDMFVLSHSPVIAYDLKTDSIVWQTDIIESVSNFFVSNGVIYFLDNDAIFRAIDEQTGANLGYVQFEPTNPSKAEHFANYGVTNYTVVADGNSVALYFSETKQLFFFHFAGDSEP